MHFKKLGLSIPALALWCAALSIQSPAYSSSAQRKVAAASPFDAETQKVLKAVSQKYKKLKNWEATFTEERFSVGLGRGSFNEGKFTFSAPNRFRYSLMQPEASDFISDGKTAWLISYKEGRAKPAFVRHFHNLKDVELDRYLLVLRGIDTPTPQKEKELSDNFAVKGKMTAGGFELELEPKKQSEVARITIVFKNNRDVLDRAIIEDSLGNKTTIILARHQVLKKVDPKVFQADYPAGSKVENL